MVRVRTPQKTVEVVDVVDERNEVVGHAPLDEVHRRGLTHRTSRVLILNARDELYIARKTPEEGGAWTGSASGHFKAREAPPQAAARELSEELGINVALTPVDAPYFLEDSARNDRAFHYLFVGRHDGPIRLDPGEYAEGGFKPIPEVERMVAAGEPFSSGFLEALRRFKARRRRLAA